MWVTDLIIEAQKRKLQRTTPEPDKRPRPEYLDLDRMLKNERRRRTRERK